MYVCNEIKINLKNYIALLIIIYGFAILLNSCASQSALEGGPKDVKPPVLLKSVPANRSINFSGKKIILYFDEFIQLKSVQQKLVVSPPLNEKPEVLCKSRSVIISFKDTLLTNTTYNLNFSDAIADLNEGNSIDDFHFCFSTGQVIDSLKISGKVLNALTQKPESGMFVMLYNDTLDSVPIKNFPFYIGKTNTNGIFNIENIKSGRYKIFALQDGNSNLLFDLPNEKIAFSDTLIIPEASVQNFTDTISKDSVVSYEKVIYKPFNLIYYAFEEDRTKQFIKKTDRPYKNKCVILFNRIGFGQVTVNSLNFIKFFTERNKRLDSISIWLPDSSDYLQDTVRFQISYFKKDSLNKIYNITETLVFPFKENEKKPTQINKLTVSTNIQNNKEINADFALKIRFSNPVVKLSPDKILLEESKDSIFYKINPLIIADSLSPCAYFIYYLWKDKMNYRFTIKKDKIKDIYGLVCDTVVKSFKTYSPDYYSSVQFTFTGTKNQYIFQLIDGSGNTELEWLDSLPLSKKIEQLNPGKYHLKAFIDENHNGKWDTGFYLEHKQAEKNFFYPDEINLRSNWEIEVKWEIY